MGDKHLNNLNKLKGDVIFTRLLLKFTERVITGDDELSNIMTSQKDRLLAKLDHYETLLRIESDQKEVKRKRTNKKRSRK